MSYTPNRVIRIPERTWDAFGQVALARRVSRSELIRTLMEREIAKFIRDGNEITPLAGNRARHDDDTPSGSPR